MDSNIGEEGDTAWTGERAYSNLVSIVSPFLVRSREKLCEDLLVAAREAPDVAKQPVLTNAYDLLRFRLRLLSNYSIQPSKKRGEKMRDTVESH